MSQAFAFDILDTPDAALFGPFDRAPCFTGDDQYTDLAVLTAEMDKNASLPPRVGAHGATLRRKSGISGISPGSGGGALGILRVTGCVVNRVTSSARVRYSRHPGGIQNGGRGASP